jgi:hypothetical protein
MCLIIFTPNIRRALIRKSVLRRGFEGNPHGCGFSYIENGELKLDKGYFTFEDFFEAYKATRERIRSGPFLIHFRYATCGEHNKINSQPIYSRNDLIMAHNGVFSGLSFPESGISDSVLLAQILNKMNMPFPITKPFRLILEALCNDYSKLVFMDKNGKWDIVNSRLGCWRAGCWYSDKGECLKREEAPGYYKSKAWRKKKGKKGKKPSMFDDNYDWGSVGDNSMGHMGFGDDYNYGSIQSEAAFVRRARAMQNPVQTPVPSTSFGLKTHNPAFGNPSTYIKPLTIGYKKFY